MRSIAHDHSRRTRLVGALRRCLSPSPELISSPPGLPARFSRGRGTRTPSVERGAAALGRKWRWLRPLAGRVLAAFPSGKPLRAARLEEFLGRDATFEHACSNPKLRLKLRIDPDAAPPPMSPADRSTRNLDRAGNHHAGRTGGVAGDRPEPARVAGRLPGTRADTLRTSRCGTIAIAGFARRRDRFD